MRVIHYGSTEFDRSLFNPVINGKWVKPSGGLWASPKDSKFGWRDWCASEDYDGSDFSKSFEFDLDDKRIYVIDSLDDLKKLPMQGGYAAYKEYIDFEKCATMYDAILLTEEGQWKTRMTEPGLYGWDCESLIILNPDAIRLNTEALLSEP